MEKSIGGDGYRPTLNSYMYADARAIADLRRRLAGKPRPPPNIQRQSRNLHTSSKRASGIPRTSSTKSFHPPTDSGIRKQKRFIDPGTDCSSPASASSSATSHGYSTSPRPHMLSRGTTLRSPWLRRQIWRHHGRAPQPALPLRLQRSMHMERPRPGPFAMTQTLLALADS